MSFTDQDKNTICDSDISDRKKEKFYRFLNN